MNTCKYIGHHCLISLSEKKGSTTPGIQEQ